MQKRPLFVGVVASIAVATAIGVWFLLPPPDVRTAPSAVAPSIATSREVPGEDPPVVASNSGFVVANEAPQKLASETTLMTALRASADPATRLALAREGNQRYPAGPGASERTATIVSALVALDRVPEARTEARQFLEAHPGDPWAKSIESLTGVHAVPVGPDPRRTPGP